MTVPVHKGLWDFGIEGMPKGHRCKKSFAFTERPLSRKYLRSRPLSTKQKMPSKLLLKKTLAIRFGLFLNPTLKNAKATALPLDQVGRSPEVQVEL